MLNKRNINIDLVKIISMFMIVILHLLNRGGMISHSEINGLNYFVYYFIQIITFVCVNLFGIVTGYLMINSKWKLKNLLSLWITVLFYSLVISFLGFIFLGNKFNKEMLLDSFFPLTRNVYWYFSSYFALYLMIPLINRGIKTFTKKEMKIGLFIILLLSTLSIASQTDPFDLNYGYSALWLAFLYYVGSYIKLHFDLANHKIPVLFIKYIIINFFLFLIIISTSFLTTNKLGVPKDVTWFIRYSSPFILISSILFFLLMLKINLKNAKINKVIVWLSPLTFSVYLIHTHPIVFDNVIRNIVAKYSNLNILFSFIILIGTSLIIFFLCVFIDILRLKLFHFIKNLFNKSKKDTIDV